MRTSNVIATALSRTRASKMTTSQCCSKMGNVCPSHFPPESFGNPESAGPRQTTRNLVFSTRKQRSSESAACSVYCQFSAVSLLLLLDVVNLGEFRSNSHDWWQFCVNSFSVFTFLLSFFLFGGPPT